MEVVVDISDFAVSDNPRFPEAIAVDNRGAVVCKQTSGWREVIFTVSLVDLNLTYCSIAVSVTKTTRKDIQERIRDL